MVRRRARGARADAARRDPDGPLRDADARAARAAGRPRRAAHDLGERRPLPRDLHERRAAWDDGGRRRAAGAPAASAVASASAGAGRIDQAPARRAACRECSHPRAVIRRCRDDERPAILAIVNAAAEAYRGVIPPDRWHEPYMSADELDAEIAAGVVFWGYESDGALIGAMGIQPVQDVELIRHA